MDPGGRKGLPRGLCGEWFCDASEADVDGDGHFVCTVTIATASKTKDRKTSRLDHEVWRKHRGLVEEDHVATIVSETARDVHKRPDIERGRAGLHGINAALMLQKCAALLEQANEDASGSEKATVGAG